MFNLLQTISLTELKQFPRFYWYDTISAAGVLLVTIAFILLLREKTSKEDTQKKEDKPAEPEKKDKQAAAPEKVVPAESAKPAKLNLTDTAKPLRINKAGHELLTEHIVRSAEKFNSLLFAGAGRNSLPITIPVNTAIHLATGGKKILLIDLDLKRNAIARAFDISPPSAFVRPRPSDTAVEGLRIWPGHNFTKTKQMNIKSIIKAAAEKFDLILINAPYLDGSIDRNQIASAAAAAVIFTQTSGQAKRLTKLIKKSNCKLIGNLQMDIHRNSATIGPNINS